MILPNVDWIRIQLQKSDS